MDSGSIFYLSIVLSFIIFGLIARWYVVPWMRAVPLERALTPLVLLHGFRFVGLAFLVPGVVAADLSPAFVKSAAYGDLLTALLALLAVGSLRFRWGLAVPLVWAFNVVGTLDFLYAFFQGFRNQIQPGQLGAMYFIPTVVVPALLITHLLIFRLLLPDDPSARR